jgi:phage protein D
VPSNTVLVAAPSIKVNGVEISAAHYDAIVDLRVSHSVSVPSQLTLRLSDPDFELIDSTTYKIGAAVDVQFPDLLGNLMPVFTGEIVSIGVDQSAERPDSCELTLTALDRGHRLGARTRVRTFQKQRHSDVVTAIASEEGLRADVTDTKVRFDYLIQTTTNYAFLDEIAFRTGFEWRMDGAALHFGPRTSSAAIVVTYGQDLRRMKARFTATNEATDVKVRSWDPLSKTVIVGQSTLANVRSQGMTGGTSPLGTSGRTDARALAGSLGASSMIAVSTDEANQLASALGGRVGTADLSVRCECLGRPDIKAGSTVEIANAGTKLSGTYYVTSVEHHFGRTVDLTTTFTTGAPDSASIVDLLGGGTERVGGFGQIGLTIGIVTNNKDPDGIGRVRVKFPALSDQEESWWARVVTPGGGSNAGLMMMPQIDDEVLVGFEHGDLRRPFVLGGLWGTKAKPPTASETFLSQNKVIEWGLKTAAGATLAFRGGQTPQDKHFKVALPDGTMQYLGSDKIELVAMNKSIELKSGQASILITDQGDIQLKGMNIKIDATNALTVNGTTIAVKAKTTMKAEGQAMIELKGGGQASLQASGVTEVKGALVKIQ